jgi:hypothetical protein
MALKIDIFNQPKNAAKLLEPWAQLTNFNTFSADENYAFVLTS